MKMHCDFGFRLGVFGVTEQIDGWKILDTSAIISAAAYSYGNCVKWVTILLVIDVS
jgi:hypothetical protein